MLYHTPLFTMSGTRHQEEPLFHQFFRNMNATSGTFHHFHQSADPIFDQFFGGIPSPFDAAFHAQSDTECSQHPTAADVLESMPILKVTERDIQECDECVICLEKLAIGEPMLRIPCGHLFHDACARSWLKSSNQCPTCRYELPTGNVEFEDGRRERMATRKPRLAVEDLSARSVRELRFLAQHLGVSILGCLEKHELVDAILSSGQVDTTPNTTGNSGEIHVCSLGLVDGPTCNGGVTTSDEEARSSLDMSSRPGDGDIVGKGDPKIEASLEKGTHVGYGGAGASDLETESSPDGNTQFGFNDNGRLMERSFDALKNLRSIRKQDSGDVNVTGDEDNHQDVGETK